MKKLIALAAFAAVALSAQAATITWGLGGEVLLVDKKSSNYLSDAVSATDDSAPTVDAGSYFALVYVGISQSTFDISTITTDSIVVDADTGSKAMVAFAVDQYGYQDPYSTATAASGYAANASFGIVWYNGASFDYVYNGDDGSAITDTVTIADMSATSFGDLYSANSTTSYKTIVAVPEPSTAMLALAGLALLIKRRRA